VRFSNLEVLQQMDEVLEQIIRIAAESKIALTLTLSQRERELIAGCLRATPT
jgi:hypothetical protein